MKGFSPGEDAQTLGDKSRDWLLLRDVTLIGLERALKPNWPAVAGTPSWALNAAPADGEEEKLAQGKAGRTSDAMAGDEAVTDSIHYDESITP